jgi:hypothetical protein
MRVSARDVEKAKALDNRPLNGPVVDLMDGTMMITFADSWLPSTDISPDWVAFVETSYRFLCPECNWVFPTTKTLRTHWSHMHEADETVHSLRTRGLRGINRRGLPALCNFLKQQLRNLVQQKIRSGVVGAELGVRCSLIFNEAAFFVLCVKRGAKVKKYWPDSG